MPELITQPPDSDFEHLVKRAEELTLQFAQHPNAAVREDALELLQTIDTIHREAILRLVGLVIETGNHDLIHRAAEDPMVGTLLQLYDVVPLPEIVRWQEVLDEVREELRGRQADVELLQVTDGMPHLRIKNGFNTTEPALRQLVNDAITTKFGPSQSVRWEPRSSPPPPAGLVSIASVQPAKRRQWVTLIEDGALILNQLQKLTVRQTEMVLVRTDSGHHAFPNACPGSALPLHMGRISEGNLICPWHSCAFAVETGKRVAGTGLDLKPFTLRLSGGNVELGVWA